MPLSDAHPLMSLLILLISLFVGQGHPIMEAEDCREIHSNGKVYHQKVRSVLCSRSKTNPTCGGVVVLMEWIQSVRETTSACRELPSTY